MTTSPSFLQQLSLHNFRNFSNFCLNFSTNTILIIGPNGSGKTNILEAISMLAQGKGLRNAHMDDQIKYGTSDWQIDYFLTSYLGDVRIEQDHSNNTSKRAIALNNQPITANELARFVNIFWLIPQQNQLFLDGTPERRKFFDRIVYNYDHTHSERVHRYEYYVKERLKILDLPSPDYNWLEIIENKLAEASIEIAIIRKEILERLQTTIDNLETPFPKIHLVLQSELDQAINFINDKAELIKFAKERFKFYRSQDFSQHRTNFGAHKTDFYAIHQEKQIPAKFCSTGEQQAILTMIILSLITDYKNLTKKQPIILLDEVFVHLDEERRNYLTSFLLEQNSQIIITTTESEFCPNYAAYSQIVNLGT